MSKNKRACAPYGEHDIGHDIDGAAEVRLRIYATEHPEVRPMMRFTVGRIMDFAGDQRLVDDGHWTQRAPYLGDVDPLKLYTALTETQRELSHFQKMWDDRKKKEQPPLSCFGFRDLMQTMQAPGPITEVRPKPRAEPEAEVVAVVPVVLEVEAPKPKPKHEKKPRASATAVEEKKTWTPAEVMAFFAAKR